jgi:hypothetical protein
VLLFYHLGIACMIVTFFLWKSGEELVIENYNGEASPRILRSFGKGIL